jgi:type VI secretion system protein ImpM
VQVGLYGKLPSHGDFLRRRTSDAFVAALDPWLQECMSASRAALGDRWLDIYLTCPAWRFAGAAGACGPAPVIGLMVPSVDRVGRYFPLTLVAELPAEATVIGAVMMSGQFFGRAERLIIETLEAEYVDFESFDERVIQLADDLLPLKIGPRVVLDPAAAGILGDNGATRWQVPIDSPQTLAPVFEQMLSHRLSAVYGPFMCWWTDGSSIVEPSCLITRGLPLPDSFPALLDGSWGRYGWQSTPAQVERDAAPETLAGEAALPWIRSAAATDVGRVREINEDAFIERPESGLWVVADGLGGHSDGENASRMVCDAFADFVQVGSLEDTIEAVRRRLAEVNEHLVRAAARSLLGDRSGSTVVALLVRGTRCAVLWAGDSRAYRFRGGRLEQLTEDHSFSGPRGPAGPIQTHAVTRAVGAHAALVVDVVRDDIRVGDRYLLCSDGLTRALPEAQIRGWMEHPDPRAAADGLIKATLDAGAPDNVTVLITDAGEDTRLAAG